MMDLSPFEVLVSNELERVGQRVLCVHIARDKASPEYLHLVCIMAGEEAGTTLVRGDLTSGWLRDWVQAWWGKRACCPA